MMNGERAEVLRTSASRDVDLLFVIDDSNTMADKQAALASSFPALIQPLQGLVGGLPNLHIGVITTDMGTQGTVAAEPGPSIGTVGQGGCGGRGKDGALTVNGAAVSGTFVRDIQMPDGSRQTNYSGSLADVFGQMARVGNTGCGFEQPLHAMRRALANHPSNAGFLRASALLAVIVVADEDDCSIKSPALFDVDTTMYGRLQSFRCTRFGVTCSSGGTTPDEMDTLGTKGGCTDNPTSDLVDQVQPYADFLKSLKGGDAGRVVVGGLIGPSTPVIVEERPLPGSGELARALKHSCDSGTGTVVGDPGVRLRQLFDLFPDQSAWSSICDVANGPATALGQSIAARIGGTCLSRAIADIDESSAGIQPDCEVEDATDESARIIPPCSDAGSGTCWDLLVDAARCPDAQNLTLRVTREIPPDPATITTVRCLLP